MAMVNLLFFLGVGISFLGLEGQTSFSLEEREVQTGTWSLRES